MKFVKQIIEKLENPSEECLCHSSKIVDSIRLYLLERLRRWDNGKA